MLYDVIDAHTLVHEFITLCNVPMNPIPGPTSPRLAHG